MKPESIFSITIAAGNRSDTEKSANEIQEVRQT